MTSTASHERDAIAQLAQRMRGRKLPGERELSRQFNISRARVRAILAELEAAGLVQRRQGSGTYALEEGTTALASVALFLDDSLRLGDDPFYSLIVERLQQVIQTEGIRCMIERIHAESQPTIVDDGIVAVGPGGRNILERLQRYGPPAVGLFIDAQIKRGARVSLLDLNNESAGRDAVQFLLTSGCRQIFYVGHSGLPVSQARVSGAQVAARQADIKLKVLASGMNYASGLAIAQELALDPGESPVGLIAANDWVALGLHTGLVNRGPDIRRLVELVSFDGLPLTADPVLAIRSLAVPIDTMAQDAVTELRRLAAHPAACGRSIRYPLSLANDAQPAV